ncbi:MAG: hypothetical protein IT445_16455 [Phycisphaeraceae bacterium]|nr:hypothetical protein [Phycisphaeraceae bacterium]
MTFTKWLMVLCAAMTAGIAIHPAALAEDQPITGGITSVMVVINEASESQYGRYADMFVAHLSRRFPSLQAMVLRGEQVVAPAAKEGQLVVWAGTCESDAQLASRLDAPPSQTDPGPEGFVLTVDMTQRTALVAGVDNRGVLYGLGRLLLLTQHQDDSLALANVNLRTAPRYAMRAANGSEKNPMDPKLAQLTNARKWDSREGWQYFEELLLLGANQYTDGWGSTTAVDVDKYNPETGEGVGIGRSQMMADYGVMYMISNSINGLGGTFKVPEDWRALDHGARHDRNVCISVPEARAKLIELKGAIFKFDPRIDGIMFSASDVAGCECEKCAPWSHTYYDLCRDLAAELLKHKPDAEVYVTNQDFLPDDNQWMFSQIQQQNPDWLAGYASAPGGSENSTYGYIPVNPKWNRYPGIYPDRTFLKSRMHYLPPGKKMVEFTDISHWKRAQNGLKVIDPIFSEVYERRTFNVRPAAYERIIKSAMPYVTGFVGYSEGNFDDFNKFMLLRLLWNPDLNAQQITTEYYTYHCGPQAAPLLAEAAFIAERIQEQSLQDSADDIQRYNELIQQAEPLVPAAYLANNWRFAMLAQRAAIDRYILCKYQLHKAIYDQVISDLAAALRNPSRITDALTAAKNALERLGDTPEMIRLIERAQKWDDISDQGGGIRSISVQKMQKVDSVGINWLLGKINAALDIADNQTRLAAASDIVNYDQPGDGGFYDNCGTVDQQPHYDFDSGELYYGTGSWPKDARPSQRSYNYSFEKQDGLEFNYSGLDPRRTYRVKLTYPNPGGVSFATNSPNEFFVLADGVEIGHAVPSGAGFDTFTYSIPRQLTMDGRLNLALRKVPGKARCTCVSEVWLQPVRE